MKVSLPEFTETTRNLVSWSYMPGRSAFSVATLGNDNTDYVAYWQTCRDRFQSMRTDSLREYGMFFCTGRCRHRLSHIQYIAAFIRKLETKLNVHTLSQFGHVFIRNASSIRTLQVTKPVKSDPTVKAVKNIIYIKLSPFWLMSKMRRSFFTMMLRCATNYTSEDNFTDALYSSEYSKCTKPAIRLFMAGHTFFSKPPMKWRETHGWTWYFRNKKSGDPILARLNKRPLKTKAK